MTTMHLASPTTGTTAQTTLASELDVAACRTLLDQPGTLLIDCREPDEHARERIPGSVLMPLGTLDPAQIRALGAERVVVHCKSGRRGADATARCATAGLAAGNMRGGIEAWRAAGLPTTIDATRPAMGVMQQTQLIIGAVILTTTALGAFVHPAFLAIPGLLSVGMMHAGLTGKCGFATLLGAMPWNRGIACAHGTCARGKPL